MTLSFLCVTDLAVFFSRTFRQQLFLFLPVGMRLYQSTLIIEIVRLISWDNLRNNQINGYVRKHKTIEWESSHMNIGRQADVGCYVKQGSASSVWGRSNPSRFAIVPVASLQLDLDKRKPHMWEYSHIIQLTFPYSALMSINEQKWDFILYHTFKYIQRCLFCFYLFQLCACMCYLRNQWP